MKGIKRILTSRRCKEVIEEKTICSDNVSRVEDRSDDLSSDNTAPSRKELIQNIFKLCGNSRELSQQCITTPSVPAEKRVKDTESKSPPVKEIVENSPITKNHNFSTEKVNDSKENFNPNSELKWEAASKENPMIITTLTDRLV